jgi:hypothetical protein
MIKKQQRWIALLVAISFAWLLQVSAMPLAAIESSEQVAAAGAEQAPGFIEQLGPDWQRPARIKLKTVLIIVGAIRIFGIIRLIIHGAGHEAAPREGASASAANRFLIQPNRTRTRT